MSPSQLFYILYSGLSAYWNVRWLLLLLLYQNLRLHALFLPILKGSKQRLWTWQYSRIIPDGRFRCKRLHYEVFNTQFKIFFLVIWMFIEWSRVRVIVILKTKPLRWFCECRLKVTHFTGWGKRTQCLSSVGAEERCRAWTRQAEVIIFLRCAILQTSEEIELLHFFC